jgi:ribosomal protein L11 methyltransferase
MAFGTGHHETTRSCLVLMEKYAHKTRLSTFLDLGTGTGILAIAASKLGYRQVIGIDTDPLAVDAAQKNLNINEVSNVRIMEGCLSDLKETYDVIAANLISGVLVQLASELAGIINPGGIAILSGILLGQEREVIDAMSSAGLLLREKYRDNKWLSLVVEQAKQT